MSSISPRDRSSAWLDAVACLLFSALSVASYLSAKHAADEAMRLYGHNVDSGAYLAVAANIYFIPGALLLGLATAANMLHWRWRAVPHVAAWIFVVWPVMAIVCFGIWSLFGP